ncbi:thiamine pyrophosphate-binding protein [Marivibrio halodurans]|uniref:Thiamine pyrophosphate-binding protein n=1 Tax=Marivibrio halodurans TaxID=2039722 RepID=A0A8J7SPE7_9PROT|nr:thiamine pyrophosphate-binding protein [Marivibrio halodurans]MBP5858588.1 thiamine pyrophosphate-binding protein [Marivibrio halodurans]
MWGSDLIAETIRRLGFRFAALNPGASYRGLHDSLVNHEGGRIDLLTCLHDEHAVALAHGWAKVTDAPALALLHSNVGLLHAAMAIHNAWVDRAPVVVLGASGAMDATRRRPWIEWIHTMQDQAAIVRPYTKWDDQPGSAVAAARSLAEGTFRAGHAPRGPVYVCMDVAYQETDIPDPPPAETLARLPRMDRPGPSAERVAEVARLLRAAERPLLVFGRVSRGLDDWMARIALVEKLGARVVTDLRSAAAFPTDHPAHVGAPGFAPDRDQQAALEAADMILALDPIDPATLLAGRPGTAVLASLDHGAHRGFVKDSHALPGAIDWIACDPDAMISALAAHCRGGSEAPAPGGIWSSAMPGGDAGGAEKPPAHGLAADGPFARMARALEQVRRTMPITLTRLPLGWWGGLLPFRYPLDYLGRDGGEGLASGPGMAVGAALALKDGDRLPVAILGDGDFVMGASALWTAANNRLPLLVLVAANGVYGNDVVHQRRVAEARGRSLESIWVGQCLDDPALDIAGIARGFGALEAVRRDGEAADLEDEIARLAQRARAEDGVCVLEILMPARTPG